MLLLEQSFFWSKLSCNAIIMPANGWSITIYTALSRLKSRLLIYTWSNLVIWAAKNLKCCLVTLETRAALISFCYQKSQVVLEKKMWIFMDTAGTQESIFPCNKLFHFAIVKKCGGTNSLFVLFHLIWSEIDLWFTVLFLSFFLFVCKPDSVNPNALSQTMPLSRNNRSLLVSL